MKMQSWIALECGVDLGGNGGEKWICLKYHYYHSQIMNKIFLKN